jgi:putative Ca2+/H+ antiporter (TMEM165/GDT1 family)
MGLHALQILPLLAFVFARRRWQEAVRVRMVWTLSASYLSLFALLLWQALRGQSITSPDETTLIAFALWGTLTVFALWMSRSRAESARLHAVVY